MREKEFDLDSLDYTFVVTLNEAKSYDACPLFNENEDVPISGYYLGFLSEYYLRTIRKAINES